MCHSDPDPECSEGEGEESMEISSFTSFRTANAPQTCPRAKRRDDNIQTNPVAPALYRVSAICVEYE